MVRMGRLTMGRAGRRMTMGALRSRRAHAPAAWRRNDA
ncbi:hypothetical protein BVI434_2210011 [Burkholderia vietnamiensis]|nr:hypothetical protein BVI434_2210011 [Burkholderia vietnamiensis]